MEYEIIIKVKNQNTKIITPNHAIGEIVYLITDVEQLPYMCIGYNIRSNKLLYTLVNGTTEQDFEEIEFMKTKKY